MVLDSHIFNAQCTSKNTLVKSSDETKKEKDVQKVTTFVLFDKKLANHEVDTVDVPHHPPAVLMHEVTHQKFIQPIIVFQDIT